MKAENVVPGKWSYHPDYPIRILYSDDDYSIIWGMYEDKPALGARWNGEEEEVGFPNQGGNPTWYVEPDFVAKGILFELLATSYFKEGASVNVENVLFAIEELKKKIQGNATAGLL